MAEEDKGTSSWYKVPMWSGDPSEWRRFKREIEWWIASLDPESCKNGPSDKQVLFELDVKSSTLQNGRSAWSRSPYWTDVVTTAGDPFAGLRKLMKALEDSMGRTEMDRKAELRKQFYHKYPTCCR